MQLAQSRGQKWHFVDTVMILRVSLKVVGSDQMGEYFLLKKDSTPEIY
jgi:hypothetical protein